MVRMHPAVWIFALMTSLSLASTVSVPNQHDRPEQKHQTSVQPIY
jgi:hypothetical protein